MSDIVRRLTSRSPVIYPGVCYFCNGFIKVGRSNGQPEEFDADGFPIDTHDFIYFIYQGHTKDCPWLAVKFLAGVTD